MTLLQCVLALVTAAASWWAETAGEAEEEPDFVYDFWGEITSPLPPVSTAQTQATINSSYSASQAPGWSQAWAGSLCGAVRVNKQWEGENGCCEAAQSIHSQHYLCTLYIIYSIYSSQATELLEIKCLPSPQRNYPISQYQFGKVNFLASHRVKWMNEPTSPAKVTTLPISEK